MNASMFTLTWVATADAIPAGVTLPLDRTSYPLTFSPGLNHALHLRARIGAHLSSAYAYDYTAMPLSARPAGLSLLCEFGYRRVIWLHASLFDGSTAVGNGLFRYGLGTSFGGSETTLLAGIAGANSNGTSGDGTQLLSSQLYEAPSATFADLHWQASPTWQFEGSALSNFNDVTRFSLGARYRLALPGSGKGK